MIPYIPREFHRPAWLAQVPTAWYGVESILLDIVKRFSIQPRVALEFGVDYGYSTSALMNYFSHVIGVDTFLGDVHAGERGEGQFEQVQRTLNQYSARNFTLVRANYRDWISGTAGYYSLIHIDIVHTFEDTYLAGRWAVEHAPVCIFHDTQSFPEVMRAVTQIAEDSGRFFYEWSESHGVGILSITALKED